MRNLCVTSTRDHFFVFSVFFFPSPKKLVRLFGSFACNVYRFLFLFCVFTLCSYVVLLFCASALCFCFLVLLHFVLLTCVVCLDACSVCSFTCNVCCLVCFAFCFCFVPFLCVFAFLSLLRVFALCFCFVFLHFVLLTCVVCLQAMQVPGLPAYNSIVCKAPVPAPST